MQLVSSATISSEAILPLIVSYREHETGCAGVYVRLMESCWGAGVAGSVCGGASETRSEAAADGGVSAAGGSGRAIRNKAGSLRGAGRR